MSRISRSVTFPRPRRRPSRASLRQRDSMKCRGAMGIAGRVGAQWRISRGLGLAETGFILPFLGAAEASRAHPLDGYSGRTGAFHAHLSVAPRGGSSPAALPALLRATHLFGLALGSALGKLRDSGVTAARMFEKAEERECPAPQNDACGGRNTRSTLGQGA